MMDTQLTKRVMIIKIIDLKKLKISGEKCSSQRLTGNLADLQKHETNGKSWYNQSSETSAKILTSNLPVSPKNLKNENLNDP